MILKVGKTHWGQDYRTGKWSAENCQTLYQEEN